MSMTAPETNKQAAPKRPSLIKRWDIHQRLQHIIMILGFTMTAVTGLPIKYNTAGISQKMAQIFGGYDGLMFGHKTAALIIFTSAGYHVLYWFYMALVKKKVSWAMVPTLKDVKDLVQNFKYFFGKVDQPAQYDRYSYKEKFDYIAVFWGMMAIGATGLMMWFPNSVAQYIPRWVIDCARMAHSDEAVLAVTFIGFIHFYNTHFVADFFPMHKTWWTGTMTLAEMEHEHPLELAKIQTNEEAATIDETDIDVILTKLKDCESKLWVEKNAEICKECNLKEQCIYRKEV